MSLDSALGEARSLAQSLILETAYPDLRLTFAFSLLDINTEDQAPILTRWSETQSPSLHDFSPYAAYVISVIAFFNIALAAGLISTNRTSNIVDIAYLFYLPFCMVFISSDRLHRATAPLFLRDGQEFVWGHDLKKALGEIDSHFSSFPDIEKEKGVLAFARIPPDGIGEFVTQLWDRHMPRWREPNKPSTSPDNRFGDIVKKVSEFEQVESADIDPKRYRVSDIQSATLKRRVRKKRGSWYQVPKNAGDES